MTTRKMLLLLSLILLTLIGLGVVIVWAATRVAAAIEHIGNRPNVFGYMESPRRGDDEVATGVGVDPIVIPSEVFIKPHIADAEASVRIKAMETEDSGLGATVAALSSLQKKKRRNTKES
jgi:hypothetical protein